MKCPIKPANPPTVAKPPATCVARSSPKMASIKPKAMINRPTRNTAVLRARSVLSVFLASSTAPRNMLAASWLRSRDGLR